MRRRLIAGGIVLAMIVAAVVGVLVARPGTPVHHGPTQAQIRAAQQRAAAAAGRRPRQPPPPTRSSRRILHRLAQTRARNLTRLLNESTPTTQVRDATTVQNAYIARRHKVTRLESKTPQAAPLAKTLTTIADDYGRLIAAGKANKAATWTRVFNTIVHDEKTLQRELGTL